MLSSDSRFTETFEKGRLNEGLGCVVQLVGCLPSMHKTLGSICSTIPAGCGGDTGLWESTAGGCLRVLGQLGPHGKFQVLLGPHSETGFVGNENLDPRIPI